MSSDKPYRSVLIRECGEALVAVPRDELLFFDPHPYVALGAPYGGRSPWTLRKTVVSSLLDAQRRLSLVRPGWRIKLFDAYRPTSVQTFMVERELALLVAQAGQQVTDLTLGERAAFLEKVYRVFAIPSEDPATPPPHSTGAVFDCTIADQNGCEIDMGSALDENSERSDPDYFLSSPDARGQQAHRNRNLLHDILSAQGFWRHPREWWHFSRGDQLACGSNMVLHKTRLLSMDAPICFDLRRVIFDSGFGKKCRA